MLKFHACIAVVAFAATCTYADVVFVANNFDVGSEVRRLVDHNGDGDALDQNESLPWATNVRSTSDIQWHAGGLLAASPTDSRILRFEDRNGDGDALDPNERQVWADDLNFAGSLAVSGNQVFTVTTSQQILRLEDKNGDGDAQDAGERMLVGSASATALQMTTAGLLAADTVNGLVYRLHDRNGDGDMLDVLETQTISTGILLPSGIHEDLGGELYVASALDAVHQIKDRNGDGDALDLYETTVFADGFSGEHPRRMTSMISGGLIVSDTSLGRISWIRDRNGDGDAFDHLESTLYADGLETVTGLTSTRAIAVPEPSPMLYLMFVSLFFIASRRFNSKPAIRRVFEPRSHV